MYRSGKPRKQGVDSRRPLNSVRPMVRYIYFEVHSSMPPRLFFFAHIVQDIVQGRGGVPAACGVNTV